MAGIDVESSERTIGILSRDDEIAELQHVFATIATKEGWQCDGQLSAYDDRSTFVGVRIAGEITGGLQFVHGPGTLPCLTVWPELGLFDRQDVAELAVLALLPHCRGDRRLLWQIAAQAWRCCWVRGINEIYAEVTPKKLCGYRLLGWPIIASGPLRPHWGEDCVPTRMPIGDALQVVKERAEHSRFFASLLATYAPELEVQQL